MSTFNKWGISNIIGFKTVEREGTEFVNFDWCKICAKHEKFVLDHNVCGATKDAAETFATGTSVVTKFNVSMSFFKVVFKHALYMLGGAFFRSAANILTYKALNFVTYPEVFISLRK